MIRSCFLASMLLLPLGCDKSGPDPVLADPPEKKGGSPQPAAKTSLPDRDPELAHRLVEEGAVLLDVRTPEEFAERHLEGAINISHKEVPDRLAEIDAATGGDKTKPIVVYCRSGHRAGIAKEALLEAGHTQVTNLGGLDDW